MMSLPRVGENAFVEGRKFDRQVSASDQNGDFFGLVERIEPFYDGVSVADLCPNQRGIITFSSRTIANLFLISVSV